MRRRAMIAALGAAAPLIGAQAQSGALPGTAGAIRPPGAKNWKALADYLPATRAEDAQRRIDARTDHSPYLQAMIDDGIEQIDLGHGSFNLKTPLRPRGYSHWRGRQRGTTLRSSIDGYIVDASASGQRLGLEDMIVKGDPALPRGGGFRLYDPSTYHVRGVAFSDFRREALHFVQGVLIAVEDCTIVDCGTGVWFDPGKTASVMAVIDRCYIAKCGVGLKAEICRALRIDDSIFESNKLATELARCDGLFSNSWLEANAQDGVWTDCSGMARHKVTSTNPPSGRWKLVQTPASGVAPGIADGETAFAEMRNRGERLAPAAGRWGDLLFDQGGSAFNAIPRAGGDPAVLQVSLRGFYEISYRATLRNGGAGPASAALRIIIDGGETLEATGSYCETSLAGGGSATLAGSVQIHLPRDAKLRLQWTVESTAVQIAAGGGRGLARSADPTNAYLAVRHLGAER